MSRCQFQIVGGMPVLSALTFHEREEDYERRLEMEDTLGVEVDPDLREAETRLNLEEVRIASWSEEMSEELGEVVTRVSYFVPGTYIEEFVWLRCSMDEFDRALTEAYTRMHTDSRL